MRTTQSTLASRLAATLARNRTCSITGAAVGVAAYLAVALLPSLLYGGEANVLLAGEVLMGPAPATTGMHALVTFGVGFGMLVGATAVAAFFAVLGAAAGSGFSLLVRAPAVRAAGRQAKA